MITDRFLTEMPFSDVAEIEILYNNERNNAYHYVYDMFTNNDCLMALDPDHNTFENCTVKSVVIMIHHWYLTKHFAVKIIFLSCT